ncbi:GNAT family N-acetyltransferase [Psychrobacillus lasiicapitis]|uniref:Acetyltransferase n=1 Tax=Psychrobacillus lasiicapitis TaxID=1636719 RepID=A0A544SYG0_9BACI|nr:GNAT family N-acetyltransferase [Psychrobacillus lasiicapitis]TQR10248.1 acetyltransferase [Psychrobacillus lasiicapitis]GGA46669.1 GNAT family N-acetyltransferase [Psychrobacillus lasiicapitis]
MLFQNDKLSVRLLGQQDSSLLAKWLSNPAVLEFYEGRDNPFDDNKVQEKFYNRENGVDRCIVEFDNTPIGYIQFYPVDLDERKLYGYADITEVLYGMDQFIGEVAYWNKGIGTLLVNSTVKFLLEQKKADRVVMDPQTWNERAIRCYEKSGFKKVKLLPKNELHEGEYRDCWLIEYTKRELTD